MCVDPTRGAQGFGAHGFGSQLFSTLLLQELEHGLFFCACELTLTVISKTRGALVVFAGEGTVAHKHFADEITVISYTRLGARARSLEHPVVATQSAATIHSIFFIKVQSWYKGPPFASSYIIPCLVHKSQYP